MIRNVLPLLVCTLCASFGCGDDAPLEIGRAPIVEPDPADLGKADLLDCPVHLKAANDATAWDSLYFGFRFDNEWMAQVGLDAIEGVGRPECFRHWAPILWRAVRSNIAPQFVEPLIEAGMHPNDTDFDIRPLCSECTGVMRGYTALHHATVGPNDARTKPAGYPGVTDWETRVEIVRAVVDVGGDPNQVSAGSLYSGVNQVGAAPVGGVTALMLVARWDDGGAADEAAALLLSAGADPEIRSLHGISYQSFVGEVRKGENALAVARRYGNEALVDRFLSMGVTDWNLEAEAEAAQSHDPARIREILANEMVDAGRIWSLWSELRSKRPPLEAMLEGGLDPNARFWGSKATAVGATLLEYLAVSNAPNADFALAIAAGADVEQPSSNGLTPLLMLIDRHGRPSQFDRRPAIAQMLLDAGADLEARAPDGDTPLLRALYVRPSKALLTFLLERGADPNVTNEVGQRPLTVLARGAAEVVLFDLLVEHGAALQATVGGVPVWVSALRHNPQFVSAKPIPKVQRLLEHIANHPDIVIDVDHPASRAKLEEAATHEHIAPHILTVFARSTE